MSGDAIAVIGGTGLTSLEGLEITEEKRVDTPWGAPSGPVLHGRFAGHPVLFLARHGPGHTIPPHRVNYRANIQALKDLGVERIVAVAAVGGIHPAFPPGAVAIPSQIVDYTWSRAHTFHDENLDRREVGPATMELGKNARRSGDDDVDVCLRCRTPRSRILLAEAS